MNYDRRAFLLQAGAGLALSSATSGIAVAAGGSPPHDAKGALAELMAGNARFVADKAACPPLTARRLEVAQGQNPFAIILSCADSRVPVETLFDQVPGNIFGVRVAGNFIERAGLGSFEYAIAALNVPLILVLGHSECGAVKATLAYLEKGNETARRHSISGRQHRTGRQRQLRPHERDRSECPRQRNGHQEAIVNRRERRHRRQGNDCRRCLRSPFRESHAALVARH